MIGRSSARDWNALTWPASVSAFLSLTISVGDIAYLSAFAATAVTIFWAAGLYDATRVRRRASEVVRVIFAVTAITAIAPVFLTDAQAASIDGAAGIEFWIMAVGLVVTARTVRARVTRSAARCPARAHRRSGPHAVVCAATCQANPATSYRVLGFVDSVDEATVPRSRFVARRTVGSLDELESILVREHIDEVHVGLPIRSHYPQIQETIRVCERVGVKLMYRADVFDTVLARPQMDSRTRVALVSPGFSSPSARNCPSARTAVLIAVAPLLATAVAIKLTTRARSSRHERIWLNHGALPQRKFRRWCRRRGLRALESQNRPRVLSQESRATLASHPIGVTPRRRSTSSPALQRAQRGHVALGPGCCRARCGAVHAHVDNCAASACGPG